jgi:hypothetical protein
MRHGLSPKTSKSKEQIMTRYEYKIVHGKPMGTTLMPWASQKTKDLIGIGSFENKLNKLGEDGWDVVSCTTASYGNFMLLIPLATAVLRREKNDSPA